jgi:methyl coenzyme M reductase subunit D
LHPFPFGIFVHEWTFAKKNLQIIQSIKFGTIDAFHQRYFDAVDQMSLATVAQQLALIAVGQFE